jgi:hypothetical protein
MLRIILVLALACAGLQANPFNPILNVIGGGINAVGGGIKAVGGFIQPDPAPWHPAFEDPLKVYPPWQPNGSPNHDNSYYTEIRKIYFATEDTARWLGKEFGCKVTHAPFFIDGAVMRTDRPAYSWVLICSEVLIDAGLVARWYALCPGETGEDCYWPSYTEDKDRMSGGKQIGRRYIETTIRSSGYSWFRGKQVILSHGPTLPPDPWTPIGR